MHEVFTGVSCKVGPDCYHLEGREAKAGLPLFCPSYLSPSSSDNLGLSYSAERGTGHWQVLKAPRCRSCAARWEQHFLACMRAQSVLPALTSPLAVPLIRKTLSTYHSPGTEPARGGDVGTEMT